MNEPLKQPGKREGPCDFFVAEQVFTLTLPVTMTAKIWRSEKRAFTGGSTEQARQLTAAPIDRLLTGR
jgi:hypothetical protein